MLNIDLIKEWLRYAHNDLIVARHLFEELYPKQTEIIAYHCQQCAEKALKAFLLANDKEPPKIHNLRTLCGLCKDIDADFSVMKDICEYLNPFGIEARYPTELAPDEAIAQAAVEKAHKIYGFCADTIDKLIA